MSFSQDTFWKLKCKLKKIIFICIFFKLYRQRKSHATPFSLSSFCLKISVAGGVHHLGLLGFHEPCDLPKQALVAQFPLVALLCLVHFPLISKWNITKTLENSSLLWARCIFHYCWVPYRWRCLFLIWQGQCRTYPLWLPLRGTKRLGRSWQGKKGEALRLVLPYKPLKKRWKKLCLLWCLLS